MPKKIIDIEASSDDNTDNDSYKEESEPEKLTKSIKKTVVDKPKKILSDKQKAVLEGARKKRLENIEVAKTNKKIEAAKLLIEQETNLTKLRQKDLEHREKKPKKKTIIIQSESESSEEEEIVIKKKRSKKPKQIVKEESDEEEEEVKEEKSQPNKDS